MPEKRAQFKKHATVPEEFYYLFWDTAPEKINLERNSRYVIERVLEIGDLKSLKWIQMLYSGGRIVEALKTSRRLSLKSKNFWTIWFDL